MYLYNENSRPGTYLVPAHICSLKAASMIQREARSDNIC